MIEMVVHCYAKKLPHFASMLCYQLSSLILDPPHTDVMVTVCTTPDDQKTLKVIDWFGCLFLSRPPQFRPQVRALLLDLPQLGRRAIGRNMAAKTSYADIVWFADVDQVYRDGILDRLNEMIWPKGVAMVFPRTILISASHAIGKIQTDRLANGPELIDIDPTEFIPKTYFRAIGGVQIVRGDTARKIGYLDEHKKYQVPCSGGPFTDFRDDIGYRKACHVLGSITAIDLPGMYRLRHMETTH